MVSLAFCLSVVGIVIFLLCSFLTVVIHSFVADSIVYWTLVIEGGGGVPTLCLWGGPHLMLVGGGGSPPYACRNATVWGFEVVSAVLFLSFGVSCLLAWLGKPFFVCHQHLWFGLSFIATGICGLFFLSLPQAFMYSLFLSWPFLT